MGVNLSALILGIALAHICELPQKKELEQTEQISSVIDNVRDQLISELQKEKEKILWLGERKKFWFRVSLCEAAVIATGVYIVYTKSK